MIYDWFSRPPFAAGVPKDKAGILVDEQFGAAILREAAAEGYSTSCPAEKSGQDEFDFEHGEDFAAHIPGVSPDLLQGSRAIQPGGRQGSESTAVRPA